MLRRVIEIDEEACNGCGLCVSACHEGAIGLVGGKARLLRDDYCDGLGDCLPSCPTGAISFVEREAAAYDEQAVQAAAAARAAARGGHAAGGCPGSRAQTLRPAAAAGARAAAGQEGCPSELSTWPIQIKLAPVSAPYFAGADLLVAADCTAFAYGAFHRDYLRGRVCLIGCPKLDGANYAEKLAEIIARNALRSVTVARMEVPCCGGLENAARAALAASGKELPFDVVTVSVRGQIL